MYAVVWAFLNLKVTFSTINSRFHLNGDPSKIVEDNEKKGEFIFLLKTITEKNRRIKKDTNRQKRIAGISCNVENNINIEGALKKTLKKFVGYEKNLYDNNKEIVMVVNHDDVYKVA